MKWFFEKVECRQSSIFSMQRFIGSLGDRLIATDEVVPRGTRAREKQASG